MSGIWITPTEFASFDEARNNNNLLEESYTGGMLNGFDPASWLMTLPDPDPVLRKTGDGIRVLRDLTADHKVLSSIQNRKLGTLKKRDFVFTPGAPKGEEAGKDAVDICKRLEADLGRVDLYNIFSQILDAPYYGCAFVEILWEPDGGQLKIAGLTPRRQEWFSFDARHDAVYIGDGAPEKIPFGKAVVTRHFPDAVNPFGLRLLSRCLWPVAIKKGGMRFWTTLCERFGLPWVIGKAPQGSDKSKRAKIASALSSMVQDAVAVVSAGTEVDIHGVEGRGGDLHPALIEYNDKAIAMVLMGQTLTADIGNTGSRAAAEVHGGVLSDYREADETLIATSMEEIARAYTKINAPPGTLSPSFGYVEPSDYSSQADLDGKLHKVGVRWTKAHFVKRYDLADDEFEIDTPTEEETPLKTEMAAPDDGVGPGQESIEQMLADILPEAAEAAAKMTGGVMRAAEQAETWEDLQILLAEELADSASTDDLEEILTRCMRDARLLGVYGETDDDG